MTYDSLELARLTGYPVSDISKMLRRMGYSPVGKGEYQRHEWQEECLEDLLKKKRAEDKDNTILLTSLSTFFGVSVDELRKILDDKGIKPLECNNNVYTGNKYERYPLSVKEILIKHFDEQKADNAELHPLVKDKNCLKLHWFPDVTPSCFEDLDKEVI